LLKLFASYLAVVQMFYVDMSSLVFEVLSGVSQTPVGRAQMDHIAALSPSHPISGHVIYSLLCFSVCSISCCHLVAVVCGDW